MPSITDVTAVATAGGYFFDDKAAITGDATEDGVSYSGDPVTPGFEEVRQPAEAVSVTVELSTGQIGVGDCTAVQYSGFSGRDPLFEAGAHVDTIESTISDLLVGREASNFRNNVDAILRSDDTSGELHTAVRYGLSQALLSGAAAAQSKTMAEVIADEYQLDLQPHLVPIFSQSGHDRFQNAEKMIFKEVPVLPHGLFSSVEKVGEDGERLVEYIDWLSSRISELGSEGYDPRLHVDVYGTLGEIFDPPYDHGAILDYFETLEQVASPYPISVESPIEAESRAAQIDALGSLREGLLDHSISIDIVADEWCNTYEDIVAFVDVGAVDIVQVKTPDIGEITGTVEAIQYCDGTATDAYLGGSCAETDVSARVCSHVALATQPVQMLAKPGMGVDEGYLVVKNEMNRAIQRLTDPDD